MFSAAKQQEISHEAGAEFRYKTISCRKYMPLSLPGWLPESANRVRIMSIIMICINGANEHNLLDGPSLLAADLHFHATD